MPEQQQGFNFGFTSPAPPPASAPVAPADDNGPAQFDRRQTKFPNATKIEDGIAYDVKGNKLGTVDESDVSEPSGDATSQAAKQSTSGPAFNFGFAEKPAQDQTQQAQPQDYKQALAGATGISAAPKGSFADVVKAPFDVRTQTQHGASQWFQDLKNDLDNGTDQTWVGWLLRKAGAKGLTYGVSPETGHLIGGPVYGPAMMGHGATVLSEHPVQGANEIIAGAGTTMGPLAVTQPEALPFITVAGTTQQVATSAAKKMGADDETAQLIGSVAGLAAGGKTVGKVAMLDHFESQTNVYLGAQKDYVGRLREFENASRQAQAAEVEAATARKLNSQGQLDQKNLIETEDKASAARANASKAQKALEQTKIVRDEAGVEMRKTARQLHGPRTIAKENQKRVQDVAGAHEDYRSMMGNSKAARQITDHELAVARGYLENEHTPETPLHSIDAQTEALQKSIDGIDAQVDPMIDKYISEPIATNVKMSVADKLSNSTKAGFVDKGLKALEQYNLTDPTMGEARDILKDLNASTRATLRKNFWDVATALREDPEFAAQHYAANALREGIDGTLQEHNVDGIRDLRSDQAALIKVRNVLEDQVGRGDQVVRGSGKSNLMRKAASYAVKKGSTAAGAAIGLKLGMPIEGAVAGNIIGSKLGEKINIGDLTRDQLAERSMAVRGAGRPVSRFTSDGTMSIVPTDEVPPTPGSQLSDTDLRHIRRENTPLHSSLASFYGEDATQTPYGDLEKRFLEDVNDKRSHGIKLEPEESRLLRELNDQNTADRAAAIKQQQDQQIAGNEPLSATTPDRVEPLLQAPGRLANGMNTREAISHDIAHVVVGDKLGFKFPDGIRSHLHAENVNAGSLMSAPVDLSDYIDEPGTNIINPEKMKNDMADIASMYVAGGVANDLWHGVPFTENNALGADMDILHKFMTKVGFTDAQASKMIAEAAENARTILSEPGVQDVIEQHAAVRESGLDPRYHVSPERLEQILADTKGAELNETTNGNAARTNGKSNGRSEEPRAGKTGEPKEGNSEKLRQNDEGRSEGKTETVAAASEPATESGSTSPKLKGGTNAAGNEAAFRKATNEQKIQSLRDTNDRLKENLRSNKGTPEERTQAEARIEENNNLINDLSSANPKFSPSTETREISTGREDLDKMIRDAGMKPAGVLKGDKELGLEDHAMFNHPETGSTMAVKFSQMSPEKIRENVRQQNLAYAPTNAVKSMKESGGFTFNPHSGSVPKDGFQVELFPERRVALDHAPTTDDIRNFMQANQSLLEQHPELHVGGFTDGNGKAELNVSGRFADQQAAINAAKKLDQISIWDNANQKEIPTGGQNTGAVPEDFTPQQRLDALAGAGPQLPAKTEFRGTHFSPVERQTLLGAERGKAVAGEEAARLQHDNRVPGVYAYREGARPESQIGSRPFQYNIAGNKAIADISENGAQRPIFEQAYNNAVEKYRQAGDNDTVAAQKALNDAEAALRDHGYDGYESGRYPGSVFLYGDQNVQPESINPKFSADRVSTRVPQGKNATEKPLEGEPLTIGRAALEASPQKLQDRFADKARKISGVKIPKGITDTGKVYDRFVRHVADNLKWLYDQVPEQQQQDNAKWYESANRMSDRFGKQYGKTQQQAAGVIASLSPQTEWDTNVSLAKRVMDIHQNHMDKPVTPEMTQKGRDIIEASRKNPKTKNANAALEKALDGLAGKKMSDLSGVDRAMAVRLYDEVNNPRTFYRIDPATGNEMEARTNTDGSEAAAAWGNFNNLAKALSILDDGSRENISNQVGESHKVRNFYNNIIDPTNPDDVTIDTHAVGAATLLPLSGNSPEVGDNFGGGGAKGTGVKGMYPLYADGYRLAAKELGVKARELQSVTWEKVRDLFPAEWKTKENLAAVKSEWKKFTDGKQSVGKTRQNILDMAHEAQAEVQELRQQKAEKRAAKEAKGNDLGGKTISALDFINAFRDNKAGEQALAGGQ